MDTKTTFLKLSLMSLFLFISSTAFSATYYVCSNGTVNLTPDAPGATITYTWDVKNSGGTSIATYPKTITPSAGVYTITMPAATTADTYTILLISTSSDNSICAPDVATNTVIVLPPLRIGITVPNNPAYCTTATSHSSFVTASPGALPSGGTISTDLETEFSYTLTKDGATVNPGDYGTIAGNVYTLNTSTAGVYIVTATIKYKQKAPTNVLLSSTGGCQSTAARTITVTTTPAAPSITVS